MKTLTLTLAIAALSIIPTLATAQNGSQFIRITVTGNSNNPSQPAAYMLFQFDGTGNDALAYPDQGSQAQVSPLGTNIYPFSLTSDDVVLTSLDARPTLTSYRTIPFGIATKDTGDMQIVAELSSSDPNLPAPSYIWLEQVSTGVRFSILDTVKFRLEANEYFESNFIIHVGTHVGVATTDESCYGYNNGEVYVYGPGVNNFTYELFQGTAIVFSGNVTATDTTLNNLAAGSYVSVIRINGIPVDSTDIEIYSPAPLIADFATDYNFINQGDMVTFTDYSTGAANYQWNYGDGDSCTTFGTASHTFMQVGYFNVTLTITDINGCVASTFDAVNVDSVMPPHANNQNNYYSGPENFDLTNGNDINDPSAVTGQTDPRTTTTYADGRISVQVDPAGVSRVSIIGMNGSVVASGAQTENYTEYAVPANGVYIVTIEFSNGTLKSETILAQ